MLVSSYAHYCRSCAPFPGAVCPVCTPPAACRPVSFPPGNRCHTLATPPVAGCLPESGLPAPARCKCVSSHAARAVPRLRVMYRLALACETSLTVITVMHRHPVAFAEMADFCQPAVVVIPPLLCRFAVHRAVCDTVRCIVVPEGDKPLILALREFPGQVITVTLRPPVKAALLYQAVKHIPVKFCMATVLVGQADDTSRSIVFHAARQTTLCGADGLSHASYSVSLRLPSGVMTAVRSPAALYSYCVSRPCVSFQLTSWPRGL